MYGREVFRSGFGEVSFEGWLATGASELTGDLAGRHHYEPVAPGSVPEAAAYLHFRKGLAREEDGYPAPSNQECLARADYFETLVEARHGTQPGTFVLLAGGTGGSGCPSAASRPRRQPSPTPGRPSPSRSTMCTSGRNGPGGRGGSRRRSTNA